MVTLQSTQTIESKVAPGVSFTLRRLSKMHIAKRDREISEHLDEYRVACWNAVDLLRKAGFTITPDGKHERNTEEPIAPEVEVEIAKLDEQITMLLRGYIVPAALKASLLSLEGVVIDGVAATTPEALLAAGPQADDLLDEIYRCSESANQLTPEEEQLRQPAA